MKKNHNFWRKTAVQFIWNMLWTAGMLALSILFFYLGMEKWMPFQVIPDNWLSTCFGAFWITGEFVIAIVTCLIAIFENFITGKIILDLFNKMNQDN